MATSVQPLPTPPPPMATSFQLLPMETNQNIAGFIEEDIDICTFRLICKNTHAAVDHDACSFWRRRFLAYFEDHNNTKTGVRLADNMVYKQMYHSRRQLLKHGAAFVTGRTSNEKLCLELIRDLAYESFINKTNDNSIIYVSSNLNHIIRFVGANRSILTGLFRPISSKRVKYQVSTHLFLQTVRVLLAASHFSISDHIEREVFGFEISQRMVYSPTVTCPIFQGFDGLEVNMEWVLHVINFWKYHMVREREGTLFPAFEDLDVEERPRYWSSALTDGVSTLGKHWKGSYAFLHREELGRIRMRHGQEEGLIFMDEINYEDRDEPFQKLTLSFDDRNDSWPDVFEEQLKSLTKPENTAKTRAQHRSDTSALVVGEPVSFHFSGKGHDNRENFLASGWLNPLPPQQGFAGWQRMTMMKYYTDMAGNIEMDALWAYEGIVLPGGQIILGRWWCPQEGTGERQYSGPFILWNVDGPQFAEEDAADAAKLGL